MSPPIKHPIPNQDSKSPEMSPPRKDPIQNKYSTIIITQKYPILTPLLENWPTLYKPFFNDTHLKNKTEEEHNDSKDNSCTEN